MKRLKLGERRRWVSWPEVPVKPFDATGLFIGRHRYRHIRVMVDAELLDGATATGDQADLLRVMTENSLVQLFRFADDGPPDEVLPDHSDDNMRFYADWAVLTSWGDGAGAAYKKGDGYCEAAIWGNADVYAESDQSTTAYADVQADEAAARRRRDVLAAQVASQGLEADLYVTEREYLHLADWEVSRNTMIGTVPEALAMLGLYFRAQGEYVVSDGGRYNRGFYTSVAVREIVPASWRWLAGCWQHCAHLNDDSLFDLAGSLLLRMERVLAARDEVHLAVNRPQHNDTADELLAAMDELLVMMMGAFDVAARVAHRVLGLASSEHLAGWQKTEKGKWLDQVRIHAPGLAGVMAEQTPGADCLTVVRKLRNHVHGDALRTIHVGRGGRSGRNFMQLPGSDRDAVLEAMDRQGGRALWGVQPESAGFTVADLGLIVDRLFEAAVSVLNQLLDATPVERLDGVRLEPAQCQPSDHHAYRLAARRSIRWQYGL